MTNTEKHIDFILKDLKSRGEIRVSKITFLELFTHVK
jgi:hypothetical protein